TTLSGGGTNGIGTLFRADPVSGAVTVLHLFTSATGDTYSADSRPIDGLDGFLYGTTRGGASSGAGAVYRVDIATGAFTILDSFVPSPSGNGFYYPQPNGLTDGGNGFLYGSTVAGGAGAQYGSLFKVSKATGAYTLVFSFAPGTSGYSPDGQLITGGDGFVY